MLTFLSIGCEKRIPVAVDFPYEEHRLFCEILGIPDKGFYGRISLINEVQSNGILPADYHLEIMENGITVWEFNSSLSQFFLAYEVKRDKQYSLFLAYDGQSVTSPSVTAPSPLLLENMTAQNEYIDSLGFKVVTYSFDASPTAPTTEQYFTHAAQLVQSAAIELNPFNINEVGIITGGEVAHIQQRLPNFQDEKYLKVGLLSLDKPLFQYLKNIKKLGSIPNDNIAGHQGNLTGSIGYFGVIEYELAEVVF